MQYFCTYIVAKIRILINMAYHVGMDYAPFRFFYAEKSVITLRHSSLVAKTPARFTCSHVNALTMAHRRCHLFARKCLWHKWFKADYAPFRFFLFPNNRLFPNLFLTPGGRGNTELFFESFVKDMSIIVAHALGSFGHGRVCVF